MGDGCHRSLRHKQGIVPLRPKEQALPQSPVTVQNRAWATVRGMRHLELLAIRLRLFRFDSGPVSYPKGAGAGFQVESSAISR